MMGSVTLTNLNKWMENGMHIHGGKDDLGFLFFYEMMTGTLPISLVPTDDPYQLACVMLRFLPYKEHQDTGVLMSILRILSTNPSVAKNASVPKVQKEKAMINVLFKGLDNIFSRLIKQVQPWLQKVENEIQWPQPGKQFTPPSSLKIKATAATTGSLPRYLSVPAVSNYACNSRNYIESVQMIINGLTVGTTKADVRTFATYPLAPINISKFVSVLSRQQQGLGTVDPNMPFNVDSYANSHESRSLIERLQKNVQFYAEKENKGTSCKLKNFMKNELEDYVKNPKGTNTANAVPHLETLIQTLEGMYQQDRDYMNASIENLIKTANNLGIGGQGKQMEENALVNRLNFALLRIAGKEPRLWFEFLVAAMLSTQAEVDIRLCNPFLSETDAQQVLLLTADCLMHTVRLGHIGRCLNDTRDLLNQMKKLPNIAEKDRPNMVQELDLKCDILANNLATKRTYIRPSANSTNDLPVGTFDPRYLVFEFIHNLMLRESQVILVDQLMGKVAGGPGTAR